MSKKDSWPQFGPDSANTSNIETSGPKSKVTLDWDFNTENAVKSAPVIADGTLYVGDVSLTDEQSYVYAVDTQSGNALWRYESGDINPSPAIDGNSLVIGETFGSPGEGYSGAITSLDRSSGTVNWQLKTNDAIFSSPTIVNGTVFVGSHDNNLYAIELNTGNEKWRFETHSDVVTSPTVTDGVAYIASGRKDGHVYAIDTDTGEEKWRFKTGEYEDFNSMDEGGVFNAIPAVGDVVYAGSSDGRLYALDAESGTEKWNFKAEGLVDSSPAVADGTVFFSSSDDYLYALNAEDGSIVWQVEIPTSSDARPIIADETLYIGAGILRAFDTDTGEEVWSNKSIRGSARPVLVDKTLYIGLGDIGAFNE